MMVWVGSYIKQNKKRQIIPLNQWIKRLILCFNRSLFRIVTMVGGNLEFLALIDFGVKLTGLVGDIR